MHNFDNIIRGALDLSHAEALKRKNPELTETHLLYGMIMNPQSTASKYLKGEIKVLEGLLDKLPRDPSVTMEKLRPNYKFQEWMTLASSESIKAGRDKITEADFLKFYKNFFPSIKINIPQDQASGEDAKSEVPDFLVNLNELANTGKLDPVIGRSKEIRRVQEILCRRTKNNPVIVGPPGVGKTAIVEGLAGLIVANQVPEAIQGRTIYALNMGILMSNTKYRGEFEEKIVGLINFLKSKGHETILFIDEIHLLIGAGKADGAMDAANLLKPALARGELHCIGATTFDEYKKYIESDSALERRFHKVKVDAPTCEDSIQILMGLKEKFEIHHGVEITDDAIVAAVYYSDQYISDRNLPDKAIDVLDEAAAGLKLSADSMPPEMQEHESLMKSKKVMLGSNPDNTALREEIKELEEEFMNMKITWDKNTMELRPRIQTQKTLEKAMNEGNFNEAGMLKNATIPKIEAEIASLNVSWKVSKKHIAEVIQRSTGVPVEKIMKSNQENIIELEKYLRSRIYGQNEALRQISDTLIAAHAGLVNTSRPIGSFLLLGPSGVGKTETAKAVTSFLFNSEKHMFRIDLSEYSEPHSVAKLIGAPPGYVGYERGGILTEAVRRNPYTVLLFDEIEKAHINFSDILLQILDDGRLTDTQGREVSFKNTIIFMTSNLKNYETYLKPELIGRIDAVLHYKPLGEDTVGMLIEKELEQLNKNLADREIKIALDDSIRNKIRASGYDERYGARPLKNSFSRSVIMPLSKYIVTHADIKGSYLLLNDEAGTVKLRKTD
ncbi:hypothetical protein CHS0354_001986 [Potamilus streckersoni]|uniref:Uncharacterized protein n=1 Tax=Potamilus streckersoni TaxID=2493646 RepID=A0AAE0T6P5_9BIVA|nr:hypothetical protein CHS0354_001986 [Potamilus streckersoni]